MTKAPFPVSAALERSRTIYRDDPRREAALDAFYAGFVKRGDLVFDVGAHVGDRTACFRRLGARVIAVEPQRDCATLLREEFGDDPDVRIVEAALGAQRGRARLHRNEANPTVSTLSRDFIEAARDADGWRDQVWTSETDVNVITLDDLVDQHGAPGFIKLDIEGFELQALKGLSTAAPVLSFEFTTIQKDMACACIDRLGQLGYVSFRASLGESLTFSQDAPCDGATMIAWMAALPAAANSGDVYASLAS
jgi:FkbM family methyltransferase